MRARAGLAIVVVTTFVTGPALVGSRSGSPGILVTRTRSGAAGLAHKVPAGSASPVGVGRALGAPGPAGRAGRGAPPARCRGPAPGPPRPPGRGRVARRRAGCPPRPPARLAAAG